ncbi:MAG: Na+/H+ antiporter NhaA [Veillonella caviae]|uniref:Na+/H+ antiporter NhaA n=1 Tax=Veillonella caviae TaxID=248316 RepID=UPI002A918C93|nr:Na+/H+ antiporter NhaA [Veillonella caviae]MDY5715930.1 Na+/H+ antiporter NhaA [Veillonella caviae]
MERIFIFLRSPGAATTVLLGATLIALIVANSPAAAQYMSLINLQLGPLTAMEWVNDALMAIFFLFVGLEVKREIVSGELNTNAKRIMPGIAAAFGVIVPAVIYYFIAGHDPEYIHGWAIPTATDIAFAIGVITALGSRVPNSMKVFLTALAVIDDLIAIIVIAIFYAANINVLYLFAAAVVTGFLIYCNKKGYVRPLPYIILGGILWYCILRSGLHATMAGVILSMTIPAHGKIGHMVVRPMQHWEHELSNWVSFVIVPVFAFFNAGVSLAGFTIADFSNPVVLGVALGLIFGKQIGIFGAVFAMVKLGIVPMPAEANWKFVYGTSIVCGIGFTMSIFVSILAFNPGHAQEMAKGGVLIGSILSAIIGYIFLRIVGSKRKECHIGVYHNC